MKKYNFYFIHGFFGEASDWKVLGKELTSLLNVGEVTCLDLFSPKASLHGNFKNFIESAPRPNTVNNVLVGYSLGGRLAQHLYLADPKLWSHSFFLSSNMGIFEDGGQRKSWESKWEKKFLNEPWCNLIKQWNDQDIFTHDAPKLRNEANFDRNKLANSLSNWSLTDHQFSLEHWLNLEGEKHWIYGEQDAKYKALHQEFKAMGVSGSYDELKGAGHRLLDKPKALAQLLLKYLK